MHPREHLPDYLRRPPLVSLVHEREEIADDDGFNASLPHLGCDPSYRLFIQGFQHVTTVIEPLQDFEPERPPYERIVASHVVLGQVHLQVIHIVGVVDHSLATTQFQDVPKAFGGDHGHPRALVLDDRVYPNGRSVREEADLAQVDAGLLDRVIHADRLVFRRRGCFGYCHPALFVHRHEVREGTADIHPDPILRHQPAPKGVENLQPIQ